jgi:hypothetical protein
MNFFFAFLVCLVEYSKVVEDVPENGKIDEIVVNK